MRRISARAGTGIFTFGICAVAGASLYLGLGLGPTEMVFISVGVVIFGLALALWAYGKSQWVPDQIRNPYNQAWWKIERVLILVLVWAVFTFLISLAARGILARVIPGWFGWLVIGSFLINVGVFTWFFRLSSDEGIPEKCPAPSLDAVCDGRRGRQP